MPICRNGVGVDFGVRHSWDLVAWSLSFFLFGSCESPGAILAIVACEEFFAFGCLYRIISWLMVMLNDPSLFGVFNHSSRQEKQKQKTCRDSDRVLGFHWHLVSRFLSGLVVILVISHRVMMLRCYLLPLSLDLREFCHDLREVY